MKSALRALPTKHWQLKLDQMTEPKTRESLKGSNFGTFTNIVF